MRYSYKSIATGEIHVVADPLGYQNNQWELVAQGMDDPTAGAVVSNGTWAVPIETLRDRKWAEVKAARDAYMHGGCATPLGRMDTDAESQAKITGAATMAQLIGAQFQIGWTMQDNTTAVHSHDQMLAAALAVGMFVAQCHGMGQAKREAIEVAVDETALDAIEFAP